MDQENDSVSTQPMVETTIKRPKLVSPMGDESPSLSEELIFEILLRVPVRSLLQFRCVCKLWKTLISNSQFAKDHVRISSADPNMTHWRLFSSAIGNPEITSFSLHSLFQNPSNPFNKARCFKTSDKYHILGSCNGLLCLCDMRDRYLILWNPSIRFVSKRFPIDVNFDLTVTFHGFGYDHVNDEYKLLVVVRDLYQTVTKIFTFGANSWKVIQNFPCLRSFEWQGKFVCGTFNWIIRRTKTLSVRNDDDDPRVILSFDVRTETYGEVLLPRDRDIGEICNGVINVLRNCLSLCFFDSKEAVWAVWLMKEHGVQDSWTKFMTIPHFIQDGLRMPRHVHQHGVFRWYHSLDPVYISENGFVILKTNFSKIILYNSNDGRLYYPKIRGDHGLHYLHVYHESLVSPPC